MLKHLKLHNFKSLQCIDLALGDLTIVAGRSSSGKSTLIAFLDLLRQAAFGDLTAGIARMGGIAQLVNWCADKNSTLCWELTWEQRDLVDTNNSLHILHHRATLVPDHAGGFHIQHELLERPPYPGYTDNFKFLEGIEGKPRILKARMNMSRLEPPVVSRNELLLVQLADVMHYPALWSVREQLRSWRTFSTLSFNASQMLTRPQDLTASVPLRVEPRGRNLVAVIQQLKTDVRYREVYYRFMTVLHRIAPDIDTLEIVRLPSGQGVLHYRNYLSPEKTIPVHHLSESTLRFIGYAALLVLPDLPSLVVLDAPETGIAPDLWELLALLVAEAAQRTQVVLTTHAPTFAQMAAFQNATQYRIERDGARNLFNIEAQAPATVVKRGPIDAFSPRMGCIAPNGLTTDGMAHRMVSLSVKSITCYTVIQGGDVYQKQHILGSR